MFYSSRNKNIFLIFHLAFFFFFPKREKGDLVFTCRCGHCERVSKNILEKNEKEKPTCLEEDYDFPNKIASRKLVKDYLTQLRNKQLIKPFSEQKVLILTHIEGYDIKQILLPLGYKKENIHIVDREKKVIDKISSTPFFNGMNIKCIDLIKYKSNIRFDLIYLDFKGNISFTLIKIINNLIMQNSHCGTVFYLNTQMARETPEITKIFKNLEQYLMSRYNQAIDSKKDGIKTNTILLKLIQNMTKEIFFNQEKLGINNDRISLIMRTDKSNFKLNINTSQNPNLTKKEIEKSFVNFNDALFNNIKEQGYIQSLKDASNKHLLRMKLLELYLKSVLGSYLEQYKKLNDYYDKDHFEVNIFHKVFPYEFSNRQLNLLAIMRYLSKSLIMIFYKQFIYFNKSHTPFLSILFTLKEEKNFLIKSGLADFMQPIVNGFLVLYFKSIGLIKEKALTLSLDSYEYLQSIVSKVLNGDLTVEDVEREKEKIRKESDIKLRNRLIKLRNVYKDLKSGNMLKLKNDIIELRIFNSNLKKIVIESPIKEQRKRLQKRTAMEKKSSLKIDASEPIFYLYLILKFLRLIESSIERTSDITKVDIIDIENDKDIEKYSINIEDEEIIKVINDFKKFINDIISFLKNYSLHIKNNIDMGDRDVGIEVIKEHNKLLRVLNKIIPKKENMRGKKTMNTPKIILNEKDIREIIKGFIKEYPDKMSSEIANMVNKHLLDSFGLNADIREHRVRAYRGWKTIRKNRGITEGITD